LSFSANKQTNKKGSKNDPHQLVAEAIIIICIVIGTSLQHACYTKITLVQFQ